MAKQQFASRQELVKFLRDKAVEMRKNIVKLVIVAGGGHVGGALSMTDILVMMYNHILNIDPSNPKWADRDRFVLSKGHGGVGICPVLCDAGYYPPEKMSNFNQLDSPFGMHPDMNKVPGIDMSTGSLGHGLSVGIGMALAAKLDKKKYRTYVLLGDGECNEGMVWEAAMAAKHYKLGNLTAIVDRNHLMIDGPTEEIMSLEPFEDKWKAFGWITKKVNGHDFNEMLDVFENLPPVDSDTPMVVIADTIKGRGVSFMEAQAKWHYGGLDSELERKAIEDIEKTR